MSGSTQKLWTYPEQNRLRDLYKEGHPLSEIAVILSRPLASVEVKSCRLGLSSRLKSKKRDRNNMNDHQLQLARELVTLPTFQSFKGMRLLPPPRPAGHRFDGRLQVAWRVSESSVPQRAAVLLSEGWLPDLADDITVLGLITLMPALELDGQARGYLTETVLGVLTGGYTIGEHLLGALMTALKGKLNGRGT
jgi:hypothetical protein